MYPSFSTATWVFTPFRPPKEAHRAHLEAVTHVDGTARVQTVSADAAPELHQVLSCMEKHNERPVVLNPSLNGPGEPIVASAADAIAFFLAHPADALVVGDVLITRSQREKT